MSQDVCPAVLVPVRFYTEALQLLCWPMLIAWCPEKPGLTDKALFFLHVSVFVNLLLW